MIAAFCLSLPCAPVHAGPQSTVEFGIFPFLSTHTLVKLAEPLRVELARTLGSPVEVYTAPDYEAFVRATQRRQYDLVMTAPHFARLAQAQAGYTPLAQMRPGVQTIIAVRQDERLASLPELRGRAIAFVQPTGLLGMMGKRMLADQGLRAGTDFEVREAGTFNNALSLLQRGEVAAAVIGPAPLQRAPEEIRGAVRVLATGREFAGVSLLAGSRFSPEALTKIRAALTEFARSAEGRAFVQGFGYSSMEPLSPEDLQPLEPYAQEAKSMLRLP